MFAIFLVGHIFSVIYMISADFNFICLIAIHILSRVSVFFPAICDVQHGSTREALPCVKIKCLLYVYSDDCLHSGHNTCWIHISEVSLIYNPFIRSTYGHFRNNVFLPVK